jgi:hypothetical protein
MLRLRAIMQGPKIEYATSSQVRSETGSGDPQVYADISVRLHDHVSHQMMLTPGSINTNIVDFTKHLIFLDAA